MSFGNRRQILKKADGLHGLMGASPYRYVLSCRWKEDFLPTDRSSFYRMLSHADFYTYFARLYAAYTRFDSLEDALSDVYKRQLFRSPPCLYAQCLRLELLCHNAICI